MTCIVGLKVDDTVFIGGDTLGANDSFDKTFRKDVKVFKNGPFVIGFSGSYRVGQILRYCLDLKLDNNEQEKIDNDFMSYMCNDFISHIRGILSKQFDDDLKKTKDVREVLLLVGYKDKLVSIRSDFQVAENTLPFDSVGCGEPYALGILYEKHKNGKLKGNNSFIEHQIREVIDGVATFSAGVGGDVTILHT